MVMLGITDIYGLKEKKVISLITAKGAVLLVLWQIFPQTVETPGQTFLLWNVNKGDLSKWS